MTCFARSVTSRLRLIVTTSAGVIIAFAPAIAVAASVRTIALSGQQAPGTSAGIIYQSFDAPSLNVVGQTAFRAELAGGVNSTNNTGFWSEGAGQLALVAREGNQAPGMPSGVTFESLRDNAFLEFNVPPLNARGQIAFRALVTNPFFVGIWSEGSGSLKLVARSGAQAPGFPRGSNFGNMAEPLMNDAGKVAFLSLSSTRVGGIWLEGPAGLSHLEQNDEIGAGTPALNNNGAVAFFSTLGEGFNAPTGMWAGEPGNLRLVARSGWRPPGTPTGVTFASFSLLPGVNTPAFNNAGQVAFRAAFIGDGNGEGIWSEGSGTLALVARSGNPAPGTPTGVNFGVISFSISPQAPLLNDAGQTAFIAPLVGNGVDGTNNSGIWLDNAGQLDLIVRKGSSAPDTTDARFSGFGPFALNSDGQIAFFALVAGDSVTATNSRGIWATDVSGTIQLVAREGDLLEVAPGDFRTISSLDFVTESGNGDGRASGFNNRGQLAFHAGFTDGTSGLFVSNVVAVPEPTSLLLLALAMTYFVRIREGARAS